MTSDSAEPLLSSASALGLLTLPANLDASMRQYHMKRLRKLAIAHHRFLCRDDRTSFDAWFQRPRCQLAPPPSIRFAFAASGLKLTMLLTSQLGIGPTSLRLLDRSPGFAVLVRSAAARGADRVQWQVHPLPSPLKWESAAATCQQQLSSIRAGPGWP
uniref:Uncharacterized protein n=1 Tax=Haptolina ericina TaxID=156174 RepID=A0A7S3B0Q5_9EUKA